MWVTCTNWNAAVDLTLLVFLSKEKVSMIDLASSRYSWSVIFLPQRSLVGKLTLLKVPLSQSHIKCTSPMTKIPSTGKINKGSRKSHSPLWRVFMYTKHNLYSFSSVESAQVHCSEEPYLLSSNTSYVLRSRLATLHVSLLILVTPGNHMILVQDMLPSGHLHRNMSPVSRKSFLLPGSRHPGHYLVHDESSLNPVPSNLLIREGCVRSA